MILIPKSGCVVVKSQGHLGNAGKDEGYDACIAGNRQALPHVHGERISFQARVGDRNVLWGGLVFAKTF